MRRPLSMTDGLIFGIILKDSMLLNFPSLPLVSRWPWLLHMFGQRMV